MLTVPQYHYTCHSSAKPRTVKTDNFCDLLQTIATAPQSSLRSMGYRERTVAKLGEYDPARNPRTSGSVPGIALGVPWDARSGGTTKEESLPG